MDPKKIRESVESRWATSAQPALMEFIRIPAESPGFDEEWEKNGHLDRATELAKAWAQKLEIPGLSAEIIREPGRTPLLLIEIPGSDDRTVLFYGHLDKQPPVTGWDEGLGPWSPVIRDGKLYGRGSADDGYAVFSSLTAIKALSENGAPYARCVGLIECCEESGSLDLPHYMKQFADRIGSPDLVLCLDSGCGNYDQMWITNSLRGMVGGTLNVTVLTEGVHSGDASGIVPSTFRILRILLGRLEDAADGRILPEAFYAEIPQQRLEQSRLAADVLGEQVYDKFPFVPGTRPVSNSPGELLVNRTWRPQLEITGAAGLPELDSAGNVLRQTTAVKVSLRLPPTVNPDTASAALKSLFESDPPYGASVKFEGEQAAAGWNAPVFEPWLEKSLSNASREYFGQTVCHMGEGGSIPLMAMLSDQFPKAGFVITGVLGPKSNAHGPNEFLELSTVKKLTCCIAQVIADHARSR